MLLANKFFTNRLLERHEIPVPHAVALTKEEFEQNLTELRISFLKFPLVIKPLCNSSKGKDVLCNIQTIDDLKIYLKNYFKTYDHLIIEEFHGHLNSYRVLVFHRKVIGVLLRIPASVMGDGTYSLEELVRQTNRARAKSYDFLGPIVIDDECRIRLNELGIGLDYIPPVGKQITLCYACNSSRGGTYLSLSTSICKENRKLMRKIASVVNIGLVGIDVECVDINQPITKTNGVIIELNRCPSIRVHEFPITGEPHLVTRTIMRSFMFQHPFAYLYARFKKSIKPYYLHSAVITSILGTIYWLLMFKP